MQFQTWTQNIDNVGCVALAGAVECRRPHSRHLDLDECLRRFSVLSIYRHLNWIICTKSRSLSCINECARSTVLISGSVSFNLCSCSSHKSSGPVSGCGFPNKSMMLCFLVLNRNYRYSTWCATMQFVLLWEVLHLKRAVLLPIDIFFIEGSFMSTFSITDLLWPLRQGVLTLTAPYSSGFSSGPWFESWFFSCSLLCVDLCRCPHHAWTFFASESQTEPKQGSTSPATF